MADTAKTNESVHKGAVEDETPDSDFTRRRSHNSMTGQLGHRDQDEMLKDADTDFPEPDAEAEHSGE